MQYEDFVFFYFRETSEEYTNCGKVSLRERTRKKENGRFFFFCTFFYTFRLVEYVQLTAYVGLFHTTKSQLPDALLHHYHLSLLHYKSLIDLFRKESALDDDMYVDDEKKGQKPVHVVIMEMKVYVVTSTSLSFNAFLLFLIFCASKYGIKNE